MVVFCLALHLGSTLAQATGGFVAVLKLKHDPPPLA